MSLRCMEVIFWSEIFFNLIQMEPDTQYQSLLQTLQRPINCLADEDRNIRRNGLETIQKELQTIHKAYLVRLITSTNLTRYLIRTYNDKIEANRESSLNITARIITKLTANDLKKEEIEPIIQGLIARINNTPFPEKSEDLRLKVLTILQDAIIFEDSFTWNITEIANALSKCLLDPCSQIKKTACQLLQLLCTRMRSHIGRHSTAIVKSLAQNLGYYKYPVRKATLIALSKLLVTESAGANLEHIQLGLKNTLFDGKAQVRKAALQCTADLINYLAPKYLKMHEATLVSFLLCGLSDESPEIVEKTKLLLTTCGQNLKKMSEEAGDNEA